MQASTENDLEPTLLRLKTEVEAIGVRGVRSIEGEQLNWLKHTCESLAGMGAEYLAGQLQRFIEAVESNPGSSAARFLELLTTIRVFQRTLTVESVHAAMQSALVEHEQGLS